MGNYNELIVINLGSNFIISFVNNRPGSTIFVTKKNYSRTEPIGKGIKHNKNKMAMSG